jgi:uncharacterized protein YcgL (UPF0745 family)
MSEVDEEVTVENFKIDFAIYKGDKLEPSYLQVDKKDNVSVKGSFKAHKSQIILLKYDE